jgi:hypothetical protein
MRLRILSRRGRRLRRNYRMLGNMTTCVHSFQPSCTLPFLPRSISMMIHRNDLTAQSFTSSPVSGMSVSACSSPSLVMQIAISTYAVVMVLAFPHVDVRHRAWIALGQESAHDVEHEVFRKRVAISSIRR